MERRSMFAWPAVLLLPASLAAQEAKSPEWVVMPGVALIKYLPGERIDPTGAGGSSAFSYSGTAVNISVRCFHASLPNLAVTIAGGVAWYYDASDRVVTAPTAVQGIGADLHRRDFNVFPLSVGVQAVYPSAERDRLMFFGGVETSVNFINGDVSMNRQVQLGYAFVGGFAVRVFEFGFRYSSFSDMSNLGAHLGLRFNPFTL